MFDILPGIKILGFVPGLSSSVSLHLSACCYQSSSLMLANLSVFFVSVCPPATNKFLTAFSSPFRISRFFLSWFVLFHQSKLDYHSRQQGDNLGPLANRSFFPNLGYIRYLNLAFMELLFN